MFLIELSNLHDIHVYILRSSDLCHVQSFGDPVSLLLWDWEKGY